MDKIKTNLDKCTELFEQGEFISLARLLCDTAILIYDCEDRLRREFVGLRRSAKAD